MAGLGIWGFRIEALLLGQLTGRFGLRTWGFRIQVGFCSLRRHVGLWIWGFWTFDCFTDSKGQVGLRTWDFGLHQYLASHQISTISREPPPPPPHPPPSFWTRIFGLGLLFLCCWPSSLPKWTSDFRIFGLRASCSLHDLRDHDWWRPLGCACTGGSQSRSTAKFTWP